MRILVKNIAKIIKVEKAPVEAPLKGSEMGLVESIDNGFVVIDNGLFSQIGAMDQLKEERFDQVVDANGGMLFPSFCDSHTHLVYAGSREMEFVDKIRGLSYVDIAKRGGGILNSARKLRESSENELFDQAMVRANEIIAKGTGSVEIKSGYGLTLDDEMKMLKVARRIGDSSPLTVKTTFLGAHAVPEWYNGDSSAYTDEIISSMIPVVASEGLADYVDVFCENGFFSQEDSDRILNAAIKYGLRPKVHANQMGFSGGVQVGVKYNAISVDHLESVGEDEFSLLSGSDTIATLLPGATMFLEMDYAPARAMIDRDIPVALATNYNPGSCPSGDMRFMMFLASLKMKMTPEEAINAATINGAFAMDVAEDRGSIAVGKVADFFITKPMPSYEFFSYSFTTPLIDKIFLGGNQITLL